MTGFCQKIGLVIFSALSVVSGTAAGACHVVSAGGNGTNSGADWNNAMANLPATLTRGDVYYLADGNYGGYVVNSPGNTTVTILKATSSDHCTDAGWNGNTMGSNQAIFQSLVFTSGTSNNVTFDGNGSSRLSGCGTIAGAAANDCGLKVDNTACRGGADSCDNVIQIGAYGQAPVTGLVMRHMEWTGNDDVSSEKQFLYALDTGGKGGHSYTLDHIYGHDAGCVYLFGYGGTRTVSNSYWWKNHSDPAICHGQYAYHGGSWTITEFNNVYRDIEGSAVWFTDNSTSGSQTNSKIYGNVIWYSNPPLRGGTNGIFDCANGGTPCQNVTFAQNVIANQQGSYSAQIGCIAGASGSGNVATNNIWFNNAGEHNGVTGCFSGDHNSFINNSGGGSCGTGCDLGDTTNGSIVANSSPVPFVNWTAGNFQLASQNANWSGGLALASPFDVDPLGLRRGTGGAWDRGVFELAAKGPAAPTNLNANAR